MAEYIDRQAFLEEQRHLYCENCEKRKGIKRGKMQFVYEIGDAPCRSCGYGDVLDDLEDFPATDVRPVVKARWVYTDMSRFPKDCWNKNCEHFHVTDMSVDDLVCACDVLGYECDACDEDYCLLRCPLAEKAEEGE